MAPAPEGPTPAPRPFLSEDPEKAFAARYASGDTPWDSGVPSHELLRVLDSGGLPGRSVLEFGCGTGTNAVELARRGYQVTAVDLVPGAIDRATQKARQAGVSVRFLVGDLTKLTLKGPFESVFDRGVYHGLRLRDLDGLLGTVHRLTRPGSRWLSLAGNSREPQEEGPPTVSEEEIRREIGSRFRIVDLREFRFDLGSERSPLGWSILSERR